jgi:hypothetical protein
MPCQAAPPGSAGSALAVPKNPKMLGLSIPQFQLKMLRTIPAQVSESSKSRRTPPAGRRGSCDLMKPVCY